MDELAAQSRAVLAGEPVETTSTRNRSRSTRCRTATCSTPTATPQEETKMVQETRKILGLPDLRVSATAVRVPVWRGHSEAVWIETSEPLSPDQARELLAGRRA